MFFVQKSFDYALGLRPVSLKTPHCGVFLALDPQDDNEGGDSGYGIHLDTDHSPPLGFLFLGRLFLLYLKRKRRKNLCQRLGADLSCCASAFRCRRSAWAASRVG